MFSGCKEDNPVKEPEDKPFSIKTVTVNSISKPAENGLRTISLTFADNNGNSLMMEAGGLYNYLDPGYYNLVPSVGDRFETYVEMNVNDNIVKFDEGQVYVNRINNYYDINFELKAGEEVHKYSVTSKSISFSAESHKSFQNGGTGTEMKNQTIKSEILEQPIRYTIYLPEGYDESKKYPILYILHGAWSHNNEWFERAALNAYASDYASNGGTDMIIVSPNCIQDCFYCNGYKPGLNYMDFFFEEFIPHIESTYAVRAERGSRAVAGLSMGGYGSLYYGLSHPDMFCHVYACSAAISIPGTPSIQTYISNAYKNSEIDKLPGLTLEMGSQDWTVPPSSNEEFVKFCNGYKIPSEYITRGGGHDWVFWNACAPKIIAKVGAIFTYNENK